MWFGINKPCVRLYSFSVSSVELTTGTGNGSPLLGALDSLTGGLASPVAPTTAILNLDLVLQVNNTNPYRLDYKQLEPGSVEIPASMLNGPTDSLGYFPVGSWDLVNGTLPGSSASLLPVSVSAEIGLDDPATTGLAPMFVSGGEMSFLIEGIIRGTGWVPWLRGDVTFRCLAHVDDILQFGAHSSEPQCQSTLGVEGVTSQDCWVPV
ncbi:expressed unknown protein [Seminavis robusta]|uniref:Uncharacterized protein n=1 Tax=Seminavis robusta TaxID=568900 RepID=A0A9N8E4U0_9STRA|nr:expressed unknown protein [Seminavis robusta]|eukprot:Sro621_g176650.1 n/a (208) ;mRNA; r:4027-4650